MRTRTIAVCAAVLACIPLNATDGGAAPVTHTRTVRMDRVMQVVDQKLSQRRGRYSYSYRFPVRKLVGKSSRFTGTAAPRPSKPCTSSPLPPAPPCTA
jgi:hypothetical protein